MSAENPEQAPVEGIALGYPESPVVEDVIDRQTLLMISFFEGRFRDRRVSIALDREARRQACLAGQGPGFLAGTESIRLDRWTVEPAPERLSTRRAEIVSSLEPEELVNALGSGADACVVDLRDSFTFDTTPLLRGQLRLRQAVTGTLAYQTPLGTVVIGDSPSTLMVRPRLLTETEPLVTFEGQPVSAGLLDVLLFLVNCGKTLVENNAIPYVELAPSDHDEALLWCEILDSAETLNRLPRGSIRVSIAIESVNAAFQADEILHAFRTRATGLSHGTWRYVQDFLESFPQNARLVHPDRYDLFGSIDYLQYSCHYLVQVAHKRGTLAIAPCDQGDSFDPVGLRAVGKKLVNELATAVKNGFDGKRLTCVRLVPVVHRSFDAAGITTDQRHAFPYAEGITVDEMTRVRPRPITERGLHRAIRAGVAQLAAWIAGRGTVRVDHFRENRASAATSRLLVYQWIRHPNGVLDDGVEVSKAYVREIFAEEVRELTAREEDLGLTEEQILAAIRHFAHSLAEDSTEDRALVAATPQLDSEEADKSDDAPTSIG